jgi:TolB-like protein
MDGLEQLRGVLAERYAVERELGRGGMATVYLATDLKHGRQVALKVLRPDLALALGPDRFLQEIRIAARLSHPNILPLHDSGEAAGLLYYVMPFVAGETLRARLLRERQLPVEDALRIGREVASGLDYAHREGFVHRDIKPENILLASGQAVIADFGLGRAIRAAAAGQELTSGQMVLGTPGYMSPEQGTGAELDGRSDVYSLGCVLYETLTGEPPFTGYSAQAVIAKHLQQTPLPIGTVRPGLPPRLEQAVQRALAKVPADRFQTAGALASALEVGEISGGLAPAPAPPGGRRRLMVALAGIALVAAGAAVILSRRSPVEAGSAAAARDPTHVAVLYFDDQGNVEGMRPIANGLTEDLIDELGRVEALSVISANGVRPFRDRAVPLDSIAGVLSVGTIVTGSVAGTMERPSVTVRLVDASTGRQLDSRSIESTGNVVTMRGELAREVARFLRERLGKEITLREYQAEAPDPAAWVLVHRAEDYRDDARALYAAGDSVGANRGLTIADSLLSVAGQKAPAWSVPRLQRGWLAVDRIDLDDRMSNAEVQRWTSWGLEHAEGALALAPDDPRGLELRGTLRFTAWYFSGDSSAGSPAPAEADLRASAVPENPSEGRAWSTLSSLFVARGSFQEAYVAARRAYENDAFLAEAGLVVFRLFQTSLLGGRRDEAARWCAEGSTRFPSEWLFAFCRLTLLWMPGTERPDPRAAWGVVDDLTKLVAPTEREFMQPRWRMMMAGILGRADLRDSARRTMASARAATQKDNEMDYYEAGSRLILGDTARVLTLLERHVANDPLAAAYLAEDPMFQPLRGQPRFEALVR